MAATSSKRPTIWLPAVFDSPSVATSAATPITVPSTVRPTRAGRAIRPAAASENEVARGPCAAAAAGPTAAGVASTATTALAAARAACAIARPITRDHLGQVPVDDPHDAPRVGGDVLVVGDHDQREPAHAELVEERQHRLGVDGVEVPGGLVAQQQLGDPSSARAIATRCCSPPESFVGRKSRRCAIPTRSSAASARSRRPVALAAGVDVGEHHVLERGAVAEQVEGLEDEADAAARAARALVVGQPGRVDPVDQVGARGRAVEAPEDVQQRRLARSRRPDDRQPVAARDVRSTPRSAWTGGSLP